MSIKAVVWDIGGVLVRTVDRGPRTRLAETLGLTYEEMENAIFNNETGQMAQLGKVRTDEVWQRFAQESGIPAERIPDMQAEFLGGDWLDTDLVDTIRRLHQDYATGIISNYFDNARHMITKVWCIADAFDHIVISSEIGVLKPDPRIYRASLEGLGVAPQEAVFLDDFLINVQGAREVGMQAIHFRNPAQALQDLRELLGEGHWLE